MIRWNTLSGSAPQIIAHRGASGEYPEHTLAGYAHALEQGADIIEPDLLPSADGVLFCRHDLKLTRSTDIALRARFAARSESGDWSLHRLESREIDELRAVQPFPGRSRKHDRLHRIPTFAAMLEWAGAAASARGRPVVLYPEIKHPAFLASQGLDPLPMFLSAVAERPVGVAVQVQCFDGDALHRVHENSGLPCSLLLDARLGWSRALTANASWLSGIAIAKTLLATSNGVGETPVLAAHRLGLLVDAWTYRDDKVGAGFADIRAELAFAMRLGVDRLFCDYPATALSLREELASGDWINTDVK